MLVRRVTNGWIALLTFILWLPTRSNLEFRPSYFSENTTSVLWLLAWWALLEWRETGRERWLIVIAGCVGWMAITRPLTAVAFAIPVGVVVLWRTARTHQWRALSMRPVLLGLAIVSLLPIWNAKVTGNWRESPYALYSKMYFPFDVMGFGLDTTPPQRSLPPDMKQLIKPFGPMHTEYTVGHLPSTLYQRWRVMFIDAFRGYRLPLALFALVSLAFLPAVGWFAVAASFFFDPLLFELCSHPSWNIYYLEIMPLFPFLTACGIWAVWQDLHRQAADIQSASLRTASPQAALAAVVLCALWLWPARTEVVEAQRQQAIWHAYQLELQDYSRSTSRGAKRLCSFDTHPWHDIHRSLIANDAGSSGRKNVVRIRSRRRECKVVGPGTGSHAVSV